MIPKRAAIKAVTPTTIKVKFNASWRVGQRTFFNSARVALKYLTMAFSLFAFAEAFATCLSSEKLHTLQDTASGAVS